MPGEYQVNVKSQSELDIGGRETCINQGLVLTLHLTFDPELNIYFCYSGFFVCLVC